MKGFLITACFSLFFILPSVTSAAGIVPCNGPDCQACHFVQLGQNIVNFLVVISVFIAGLVIAIAGFSMVTAAGNAGQLGRAKEKISNVMVGMIIVLACWLVVDTIMKVFTDTNSSIGPWNSIACETQFNLTSTARLTYTNYNGTVFTSNEISTYSSLVSSSEYAADVCAIATEQNLQSQCNTLAALIHQESSGNTSAVSDAGAYGMMQLLPSTARSACNQVSSYDCSGMSDAEIANKLLTDPTFNMTVGVQYYSSGLEATGGDVNSTLAYYNGGPGAIQPSSNCPGLERWQCEWDGNDCINGVGSDCTPNTGYIETRNYVSNITAVSGSI